MKKGSKSTAPLIRRKKGNKYHNHKIEVDGIKFDSIKESERYLFLKKAQERGEISDLSLQVKFELIPAVKERYIKHLKTKDKEMERTLQLPITYICDFTYMKDREMVIEDVKPSEYLLPKEFRIKEKLFFWRYHKRIKLIFKANNEL